MEEKQHGSATQVGPSMAPKLEVIRGENVGETYKVKLTTRIGREQDNDIIILDPKMSRYHAQISMEAGQWLLTDLGSSNHTYLNGTAVTAPTPLKSGDRIGLGETELVLNMPGAAVTEPDPARTAPMPVITPRPSAAPPTPAPAPGLPRLAWIAGGFVLLLFLVAGAILYFIFSRPPAGEETTTEAGTPAAIVDSPGNEVQPPAEAPNRPTDLALIYEDDFGDSFSGWDDAFDAYTTKQYGNNRYQIEVTTSNLVAWGLANRDVADFEVEVEAKLEDGADTNGYGLLFRFQDRENFYRFDISGDGYYLLSKFVKGEWTTLVDWTASPFINKGKSANILKVSAFGPNLTIWANGQQLASAVDDSLSHGNFGFFAGTFSEPRVWVSFDTLKLWGPKNQEITLLPTATRPRGLPATLPYPPRRRCRFRLFRLLRLKQRLRRRHQLKLKPQSNPPPNRPKNSPSPPPANPQPRRCRCPNMPRVTRPWPGVKKKLPGASFSPFLMRPAEFTIFTSPTLSTGRAKNWSKKMPASQP
ncbi:MAG: FHA domain-containing protein [Anaerolineales bacterium]|nr:FHA domain-containing protein [Anaerolineales bacterium]